MPQILMITHQVMIDAGSSFTLVPRSFPQRSIEMGDYDIAGELTFIGRALCDGIAGEAAKYDENCERVRRVLFVLVNSSHHLLIERLCYHR